MYKHMAILALIIALTLSSLEGCIAPTPQVATPVAPVTPASPPAVTPSPPAAPDVPSSPRAGVEIGPASEFGEAGRILYDQFGAPCHGANGEGKGNFPAIIGAGSALKVYGNAQALYDFISTQMPLGKGGTLSKQQYLRLTVFLLVQNKLVSPSAEIRSDQLGSIKLQ
jgi:hypothetical protein